MDEASHRYWAFLSYSHADRHLARRLHAWLEGFSVPARLVGRSTSAGPTPRRFRPVFRDRDELPATASLSAHLIAALRESAYLIVVCSPDAARSHWVNEEIRQFKHTHGEARVLAFIVSGTPNASETQADRECFPKALRYVLRPDGEVGDTRAEPAAADARPARDGLRRARLKLIAGMLQVDLDEVVHREALQRYRRLSLVTGGAVVVAALMTALAVVSTLERRRAEAERAQAEGLIEFMIGDLRKTLEPSGHLDALNSVGARALTYYAAQQSLGIDDEALGRRSRVLHMLGEIREQLGDERAAEGFFEEASTTTAELLRRNPDDPQRIYDHAQSSFYLGETAFRNGEYDIATRRLEVYVQLASRLVRIDPHRQDWWAEVDEANTSLGAVLLRKGDADQAASHFSQALQVAQRLAHAAPDSRDRQWDAAQAYAWLADSEVARGRLGPALEDHQGAGAIYASLIARDPADTAAAVALAADRTSIARIHLAEGEAAAAIAELQSASREMDSVIAATPDNTLFKANAIRTYLLLGQALLKVGRLAEASQIAAKCLKLTEPLARSDSGIAWQGFPLGASRMLGMEIDAQQAGSPKAQITALEPATAEAARLAALLAKQPRDPVLARTAAETALLAGDYARLRGDTASAVSWWLKAQAMLATGEPRAAADRSAILSSQLTLRLTAVRSPAGPETVGRAKLVDYKW